MPACHSALKLVLGLAYLATAAAGADLDEFKIKREESFAFAQPLAVTREGDRIGIAFETTAFCDVTVAIENAQGRIVRHLASGVLGEKAPLPLAPSSKKQTLVWDGKDDAGKYVEDKDSHTVRVSLGLKARYEKDLWTAPAMRLGKNAPLLCATPEGVLVYESSEAFDSVRLYDHDGNYARTVYPFAAGKVDQCQGLLRHVFPQDGKELALKGNFLQSTMLTSGDNAAYITYKPASKAYESVVGKAPQHYGMTGYAATSMATDGKRIALAYYKLNRLSMDGTTGGQPLEGPATTLNVADETAYTHGKRMDVGPTSAALSPDGKTLYLAGYSWQVFRSTAGYWLDWLHGVTRIAVDGSQPAEIFKGSAKQGEGGTGSDQFFCPASVACDQQGRLYVADHLNDRVQVYGADGKLIRSIATPKPAVVCIHHASNELYVFSWLRKSREAFEKVKTKVPATLTRFGPLDDPKAKGTYALPLEGYSGQLEAWDRQGGGQYNAIVDPWAKEPVIWLVPGSPPLLADHMLAGQKTDPPWARYALKLFTLQGDKLVLKKDMGKEAAEQRVRLTPPLYARQKLYVNPADGMLYVWEGQREDGTGSGKGSQELIKIDPRTGKSERVALPFDAEDICFDQQGLLYLKTRSAVGRFDLATWREVPWDYGEELKAVGFASGGAGKVGSLISGLPLPANLNWQHGGMAVSVKGHLAVACYYSTPAPASREAQQTASLDKPYTPKLYPGRAISHSHGGTYLHIWDNKGKLVVEDALPGLAELDGIHVDDHGDLYVMTHATRVLDGKCYYNDMSGTLIKFTPGKGRILSNLESGAVPVTLSGGNQPQRPFDLSGDTGGQWVEGAHWMYGGVGYGGKNRGVGCACFNARATYDYFDRSFGPEVDRYRVAVLDANGNLILRIGQYGNRDSAGPGSRVPLGGDEVGLFHGAYLGTHGDRNLYIADYGNQRIVSVKLEYHVEARKPLKEIPDQAAAKP